MTPEAARLGQIGEALFGLTWQSDLARALGVGARTVRHWVAEDSVPPAGIWRDLEAICRERIKLLNSILVPTLLE